MSRQMRVCVLVMCAMLAACSLPEREVGFHSRDPAVRVQALREAIANNDRAAIPHLIAMLDSEDPALRMFAQHGLERMTGQRFGYDHASPPAQRGPAVDAWVAWWQAQSDVADGGVGD